MQSRQPFVMEVRAGFDLDGVGAGEGGSTVLLWEGAAPPLRDVLVEQSGEIHVVVGPEGGFTDAEVDRATEGGARLASLGPGILRTETAAVVGAALVLSRYGRLG